MELCDAKETPSLHDMPLTPALNKRRPFYQTYAFPRGYLEVTYSISAIDPLIAALWSESKLTLPASAMALMLIFEGSKLTVIVAVGPLSSASITPSTFLISETPRVPQLIQ